MTQDTPRAAPPRSHKLSAQPTLAVFAPFGTDAVLSTYPDGQTLDVASHPLVRHLCEVADTGVNVLVLFDRFQDATWLVQIPAHRSGDRVLESQGTLDMRSHRTLADFVALAHRQFPQASLVLTFEGHGAGFLPDLDLLKSTRALQTDADVEWRLLEDGVTRAFHASGSRQGQPVAHKGAPLLAAGNPTMPSGQPTLPVGNPTLPVGNPTLPVGNPTLPVGNPTLSVGDPTAPAADQHLPVGNPTLPVGNPTLPTNHMVISTWALGAGLKDAGVPRIAVIHFNNCFNMSVEVLHTVAPYAEFATGYCNYNFFTAGQAYPGVFRRLAEDRGATAEQVAKWFAEENHIVLNAAGHEPTVAGTVELARMTDIAHRVDELADALLEVLQVGPDRRAAAVRNIEQAIVASQQYDSRGDNTLAAPDELTDLDSFATELGKIDFGSGRVTAKAAALRESLGGIKQYGDDGSPWMAPDSEWNFSSKNLAMNIFLPDPLLNGLWDWRSQYYLDVNPDPTRPQRQRHVIEFLTETDWVDFLIEYHKDTPLVGLLPAQIPVTPMVHTKTDPRRRRTRA